MDLDAPRRCESIAEPREGVSRPKGGRGAKARHRLAAAGVAIEDTERPREGRSRKAAGHPTGPGLRDGADLPLRNLSYELTARHVSAGLPALDAWVMAGLSPHNARWLEVTRHQDFVDRVAEHMRQDRTSAGISLAWVQTQLLRVAATDPGAFLEPVPFSSRFRLKNVLDLPVEVRQSISEITFDRHGKPVVKFHDRMRALAELSRMVAPSLLEVHSTVEDLGRRLDQAISRAADPRLLTDADVTVDGAGGADAEVPRPVRVGDRF